MLPREENDTSCVILLVEDDPAHAELIKRSFDSQRVPHRIIHVTHGEAALDYLFRRGVYGDARQSPRPHIILLDLRLPRISGFDVLEEIKADVDLRTIPVIVLTTSQVKDDAIKAYRLYANSFVVKPVDFEKFMSLIKELGSYWLHWNYYGKPREKVAVPVLSPQTRRSASWGLEEKQSESTITIIR